MKRAFITIIVWIAALAALACEECGGPSIEAYIIDDGTPKTNIRCTPNGKIAMSVNPKIPYMVTLANPKNGWWEALTIYEPNEEFVEGEPIFLSGSSTGKYFIHNSMVGFETRTYGESHPLRAKPSSKGKVVCKLGPNSVLVHPIDLANDEEVGMWIKVKTDDGREGWIELEMICSNPLTTCP